MRQVKFDLIDRLKLVPVEIVNGKLYLLGALFLSVILASLNKKGLSFGHITGNGFLAAFNVFCVYLSGTLLTPLLLPYIPFRSFSLKGMVTGLIVSGLLLWFGFLGDGTFEIISWFLIISTISSVFALGFTGASTYTSLSGVKKEMKISVPFQILFILTGVVFMVIYKIR